MSINLDLEIEDIIIGIILDGTINQDLIIGTEEFIILDIEIYLRIINLEDRRFNQNQNFIRRNNNYRNYYSRFNDRNNRFFNRRNFNRRKSLIIDSQIPTCIPIISTLIRITFT